MCEDPGSLCWWPKAWINSDEWLHSHSNWENENWDLGKKKFAYRMKVYLLRRNTELIYVGIWNVCFSFWVLEYIFPFEKL